MNVTHYIGFDIHKKSIQYCAKTADGAIVREGRLSAERAVLVQWALTLTEPWHGAMEATLFSGWVYDALKPHAAKLNMAHPLMMKAIGASKKKSVRKKVLQLFAESFASHCPNLDNLGLEFEATPVTYPVKSLTNAQAKACIKALGEIGCKARVEPE